MNVELLLTPAPLKECELIGKTVVVVDVLRSSTSICAALRAGAKSVIPTATVGQAGELRNCLGSDTVVLAGEQQGIRIDNFDFGNSPGEFTAERVRGKMVVMVTTNGTAPFSNCAVADSVVACGLVNISLAEEHIITEGGNLMIVCAGREGGYSLEDTICGGFLCDRLIQRAKEDLRLNDAARLSQVLYLKHKDCLAQAIRESEHGRYLSSIGHSSDIETAVAVDSIPVLPVLLDGRLLPATALQPEAG